MRHAATLLALALAACSTVTRTLPDTTTGIPSPDPIVLPEVAALLAAMTLDEKLGQMTLVEQGSTSTDQVAALGLGGVLSGGDGAPDPNTPEAWLAMVSGFQEAAGRSRLGVPILYGVDAVHGHALVVGATVFPHNIGLGAAGDPDLVAAIARATAAELVATGIRWNYAPVVAVARDSRWGRTYEAFGDDPELVARLGAAALTGYQGVDLSDPASVMATPKHFAGDGGTVPGTSDRPGYLLDQGLTDVDEATFRSVHLAPYRGLVEDAHAVMASFSSWRAGKVHGDRHLLTNILRGELAFEGFLVSDWGAVDQIDPADYRASVVAAITAGVDLVMVPYDAERFIATLKEAVLAAEVPMVRIDEAVTRILTAKVALGLFEAPVVVGNPGVLGHPDHRALARSAAARGTVLLATADAVLPIRGDTRRVFVTGAGATDLGITSGGWTVGWQGVTGLDLTGSSVLDGRSEGLPDTEVVHRVAGGFGGLGRAEVGIAVVAERPYAEGDGDTPHPAVAWTDIQALTRLRAVVDRLVVVVVSGRPVATAPFEGLADAIVAAWLPGTEAAGVADVLTGARPFTALLPLAWPDHGDTADREGRGECEQVRWPRGHGLAADGTPLATPPCP